MGALRHPGDCEGLAKGSAIWGKWWNLTIRQVGSVGQVGSAGPVVVVVVVAFDYPKFIKRFNWWSSSRLVTQSSPGASTAVVWSVGRSSKMARSVGSAWLDG